MEKINSIDAERQKEKLTKYQVIEIWNRFCGKHQAADDFIVYLSAEYITGNGKSADIRLYPDSLNKGFYYLYLNDGDGEAIIELREKLEAAGLPISRIAVQGSRRDSQELAKKLNQSM